MKILFSLVILLHVSVNAFEITKHIPEHSLNINTNSDNVCLVAKSTLKYLNHGQNYDSAVIHAQKFKQFGLTYNDIKSTLEYICQINEQDKHKAKKRLNDIDFLRKHFTFYRFSPDIEHARRLSKQKPLLQNLPKDKVLMTKYYVHEAKTSAEPNAQAPFALYQIPNDERQLSLEQAEAKKESLTRYKYTKQQVLDGAVTGLATPLTYLSRVDLEAALMQGTLVAEQNGQTKVYNVHRNNAIAYDRRIKPYEQGRYWYFKQVAGILGYGKDANNKVTIIPEVTFAGDIFQFGLGHLMLAQFDFKNQSEYRMAILADTGGAFEDNLYQLDYLAGSYPGIEAYREANRHLPDYISVWFLIKKERPLND